eukprot:487726-Amphidinium_carterae.1
MPAPRADAQHVPMEQDPELQVTGVTGGSTADSSGAIEAPPPLSTVVAPGQARARGARDSEERGSMTSERGSQFESVRCYRNIAIQQDHKPDRAIWIISDDAPDEDPSQQAQ